MEGERGRGGLLAQAGQDSEGPQVGPPIPRRCDRSVIDGLLARERDAGEDRPGGGLRPEERPGALFEKESPRVAPPYVEELVARHGLLLRLLEKGEVLREEDRGTPPAESHGRCDVRRDENLRRRTDPRHRRGDGPGVGPIDVRGGGHRPDIVLPVPLDTPSPRYPDPARILRMEGAVVLSATIDASGRVVDVAIEKGVGPFLDRAAIEAVSRWRYVPARIGARPVAVILGYTALFLFVARLRFRWTDG